MSKNKKRMTNPLEKKLPMYLQNMLWYNLEYERENRKEVHYFRLDVTENEEGKLMQKIIHTYKIPEYHNEHLYTIETPIKAAVVIKVESSGVQLMMLADESEMKTETE